MCLCGCFLSVKARIVGWCRHYIFFSKASSFLLGLAVAHSLVKNAVVDILMLYLTEDWKNSSLTKAAAIVNIDDAISGVIALIIAILSEFWVGRFKMVLSSTAAFILGLFLLWISTSLPPKIKYPILYVALFVIAIGKAGKDPPLKNFINDQLRGNDPKQVEDRTTFWWQVCRFTGATISVFCLTSKTWKDNFLICAVVMAAAYLIFSAGTYCPYNYTSPPGKYFFSNFLKVLKAAFAKRHLSYPVTPSGYFLNQGNELPIFPPGPFLRCVDKAAIVEQKSIPLKVEAKLEEENLCSVEEVRQSKSLLRLIPLWMVFSLYGIVKAAGDTFFIEQSSGLDEDIPVNSLFIIKSFVAFIASYLANLLISRYCSRNEMRKLKGALMKVGVGIGVSVICCEVASLVERARLDRVYKNGNPDMKDDVDLHMSILWLTPQFVMLGLMEGLSEDGLGDLFCVFVHESMEGIGDSINQLVLGFGNLLSIGCTLVFKKWFGGSISSSRLDKYFNMLMYLSLGNLAVYVLVGYYYVYIQRKKTQLESYHAPQEVVEQKLQELMTALVLEPDENEDEEAVLVEK